ncbi:TPA: hypothetical protein HA219_03270 [Candidatus Woesearchaeota archaeon]|nr:hypothetical protein [Candidatus Woesearchaeota archaeon]HIH39713.1 hypothetical protein [Candidatus Woesearchaeota archaeon]
MKNNKSNLMLKLLAGAILVIILSVATQNNSREFEETEIVPLIKEIKPIVEEVIPEEPVYLQFNKTLPNHYCWYVPFYVEYVTPDRESNVKVTLNSDEKIRVYAVKNAVSSFYECVNNELVNNTKDYDYITDLEDTFPVTNGSGLVIRAPKGGNILMKFKYESKK